MYIISLEFSVCPWLFKNIQGEEIKLGSKQIQNKMYKTRRTMYLWMIK